MFFAEHFRSDLSRQTAAALFKTSVKQVEMSISSFCNRRCPYCPNAKADRISQKHQMSDALFYNVLRQLREIDYSELISIHRYNEPLADRDLALRRVREIRAFVPNAKITIFTNGDYLDAEFVRELAEAGVYWLGATMHEAPNGTPFPDLLDNQTRFLKRLGLPFVITQDSEDDCKTAVVDTGTPMQFVVWARNFWKRDADGVIRMHDRGQSLGVESGVVRTNPCFIPFLQMQIEWDGQLLPCCEIQPDVFETDKYTLGRLTPESDIFLAWTNATYVAWRSELFSYEVKKTPCATCSYGCAGDMVPDQRLLVEVSRQALQLDAPTPEALVA